MVGHVFLGRYQALRLLGEGGMGQVFLARDLRSPRQVVIKVIREEIAANPKVREIFQREMDFMSRFRHPYAVALHDASINDPQGPCIVMEYIPGITLEELLRRQKRLGVTRVGRMLGQLCQVLQSAHAGGIIHRDLKPANIMVVDPNTPGEKIKVMDFGLAKLDALPHIPLEKLNDPGALCACGTPEYMCPEQIRGDEVDHRGDLYSLGVILYELLSGQCPFAGDNTDDIMAAQVSKKPPRFDEMGAGKWVPPGVEAVIQNCLAKYPNERPQSARELAERFEKALGQKLVEQEEVVPPSTIIAPTESRIIRDPNAVVMHLDAWMPERIAVVKLRGFVNDIGGEVVESVPGLIRVRLDEKDRSPKPKPPTFLSLIGLSRKPPPPVKAADGVNMELHMQKKEAGHQSLLHITVLLRPEGGRSQAADPSWRPRCDKILRELRAYLIGTQ